jgi:hypothetical protein
LEKYIVIASMSPLDEFKVGLAGAHGMTWVLVLSDIAGLIIYIVRYLKPPIVTSRAWEKSC